MLGLNFISKYIIIIVKLNKVMGNLRTTKRKLNVKKVWIAKEVEKGKVKLNEEFKEIKTDIELIKEIKLIKDIPKLIEENLPMSITTTEIKNVIDKIK